MNRLALTLLACLAVVANLAVPQRLLIHKPCCYDATGRLMADAAMTCKQRTAPETVSGPDCCAPDEYQLRPAPPSDSLTPDQDHPQRPDTRSTMAVTERVVLADSSGPCACLACAETGCADVLLSLHSRLNL